ncbi:MAG: DUF2779 domain-containing protein [Verrucomicrobia bacterium]|nr:DUF2779 domain-containing protein [Verrucomicrobiota bacterium]
MPPIITKSKFMSGLQCSKLLWSLYNAREQFAELDARTSAILDQGNEVTAMARSLFPNGIDARSGGLDFSAVVGCTKNLLQGPLPIFEASISYKDAFASADILEPADLHSWNILEVKSSTSVKEVHLNDLAFQWFVYAGAGLNIAKAFILHINNEFVKRGAINPQELFTRVDVTEQVTALLPQISQQVSSMHRTISAAQCPEIIVGDHCSNPYQCPLTDRCWAFLPAHNVFTLVRGGEKKTTLFNQGVLDIKDIPEDFGLSSKQSIQRISTITGTPYVEPTSIAAFLQGLIYPLYFLDFETFSNAIPLYDGVKPYQQVPFQFSLHILRNETAEPEHYMFLADGVEDPRPSFLRRLKEVLGETGSIVTYNAAFEKARLRECCSEMGGLEQWLEGISNRIVDLLVPFRAFHFYHPEQKGSASMKAVLPALTGKNYSHLEIQDGGSASSQFLESLGMAPDDPERARIRRALEEYCTLDTSGMIDILNALKRLTTR